MTSSGTPSPGTPTQRLADLGVELPPVVTPVGAYVPASVVGGQVWSSGQVPIVAGEVVATGRLGDEVDLGLGYRLARICALNALAAMAQAAGGLDAITKIVKATIFVASEPGFGDQAKVGNGASELIGAIFGDNGRHVRSAVGVAALPLNVPVEVELIGLI